MKKILIVGAKGMLGQDLVKIFSADSQYQVQGWDREEINITNKIEVLQKIFSFRPDVIINAAAYNAVDKCEEDFAEFELAKQINGYAVGYLASVAQYLGGIMVHYSTDYVFDGELKFDPANVTIEKLGYHENSQPSPISRYGLTKYLGEFELRRVGGNFYLIRTSRLFGLSASSAVAKKSFFEQMQQLGKIKDKLEVVNEEVSCFTYSPDLAEATKKIIEESLPYGIYHQVNQGVVSWYDAVREFFKIIDIKIPIMPVSRNRFPRPARIPKYSVLASTKLPLLRPWQDALKDFLSIIKL